MPGTPYSGYPNPGSNDPRYSSQGMPNPSIPSGPGQVLFQSNGGTQDSFILRYVINAAVILLGIILLFANGFLEPIIDSFKAIIEGLLFIRYLSNVLGYFFSCILGLLWNIIRLAFRICLIAGGIYCIYKNVKKSKEQLIITTSTVSGVDIKGMGFSVPLGDVIDAELIKSKYPNFLNVKYGEGVAIETRQGAIRVESIFHAQQAVSLLKQQTAGNRPARPAVPNMPAAPQRPY